MGKNWNWQFIGGLLGFLAVALGAFGAHGLKALLTEKGTLEVWQTASQYHLIHAVAILLPASQGKGRFNPAFWFLLGVGIFSGSLYVLAITGVRQLGMVTPIGGMALLVGWLSVAFSALGRVKA